MPAAVASNQKVAKRDVYPNKGVDKSNHCHPSSSSLLRYLKPIEGQPMFRRRPSIAEILLPSRS